MSYIFELRFKSSKWHLHDSNVYLDFGTSQSDPKAKIVSGVGKASDLQLHLLLTHDFPLL